MVWITALTIAFCVLYSCKQQALNKLIKNMVDWVYSICTLPLGISLMAYAFTINYIQTIKEQLGVKDFTRIRRTGIEEVNTWTKAMGWGIE